MTELYRPKTREELRAETWEVKGRWQAAPDRPWYTLLQSEHGWWRWRRGDRGEFGWTTGRWLSREKLLEELRIIEEERRLRCGER